MSLFKDILTMCKMNYGEKPYADSFFSCDLLHMDPESIGLGDAVKKWITMRCLISVDSDWWKQEGGSS